MKDKVIVTAAFCKKCNVWIYSRASHDYNFCVGGCISIDGGDSYTKLTFSGEPPILKKFTINATRGKLYDDWNLRKDKYGTIQP